MRRYRESLEGMQKPALLSQTKATMDLRGLMAYAKERGVKVSQLSEAERMSFAK